MISLYEPDIKNSDINNVTKVLKEGWVSGNTPVINEFEEKLSTYLDVKYAAVCSSGTSALHLALLSCGVESNDEVIMPSLSYIATANAVSYIGAKPVFIDVNINDWQIDTSKIEESITKSTKAILPVHLYGGVPDLSKIEKIAKKYNLKIIHDSAEALGSLYKGKHSGGFRDLGIYSFFPNKVMTTGEGGVVITDKKSYYDKIIKLRSQGLKGKAEYVHDVVGYNYRMTSMSAALGIPQIKRIERNIKKKEKIYKKYMDYLAPHGISFQEFDLTIRPSYWLSTIILPKKINRNKLKAYLFQNKIDTRNMFTPIHKQKPYLTKSNLVNSEFLSKKGLCLPSSPNLSNNQIKYISEKLIYYLKNIA